MKFMAGHSRSSYSSGDQSDGSRGESSISTCARSVQSLHPPFCSTESSHSNPHFFHDSRSCTARGTSASSTGPPALCKARVEQICPEVQGVLPLETPCLEGCPEKAWPLLAEDTGPAKHQSADGQAKTAQSLRDLLWIGTSRLSS